MYFLSNLAYCSVVAFYCHTRTLQRAISSFFDSEVSTLVSCKCFYLFVSPADLAIEV